MAYLSKIEWCDSTFNPWLGCTKVSPGCANCYAEREMDHHYHKVKWGPQGTRLRTGEQYWKKPLHWNRDSWVECDRCGWRGSIVETTAHLDGYDHCPLCLSTEFSPTRQRVFCASLADIFEDRPELEPWRADLWSLIEHTPNLDWLLLTKRPENIRRMFPDRWSAIGWGENPPVPRNIWMGVSAEDQETFERRTGVLLSIAKFFLFAHLFLSAEPLLGQIDLRYTVYPPYTPDSPKAFGYAQPIDWVIAGGESGPNARSTHPDWLRLLRDQCQAANVPFHFKQWGEWAPAYELDHNRDLQAQILLGKFPEHVFTSGDGGTRLSYRVGRSNAFRTLDGQLHGEFPS